MTLKERKRTIVRLRQMTEGGGGADGVEGDGDAVPRRAHAEHCSAVQDSDELVFGRPARRTQGGTSEPEPEPEPFEFGRDCADFGGREPGARQALGRQAMREQEKRVAREEQGREQTRIKAARKKIKSDTREHAEALKALPPPPLRPARPVWAA